MTAVASISTRWSGTSSAATPITESGGTGADPTVPPRVDYALTGPGCALRETVDMFCEWTRAHLDHIEDSRTRFDA